MVKPEQVVSNATLKRLPMYLRFLKALYARGEEFVSSVTIANGLELNSVQVKKDIALVSRVEGKPKVGFELKRLIDDLEDFLGLNSSQKAVLVGVGKLGTALLSYKGFEKYGLMITAGFDVNPDIVGKEVAGIKIYHESDMANYLKKHKIKMAILAVQTGVAQKVCDKLVKDGIYAILNFSPVPLKIPDGVAVQDVDIAASLAILSTKLKVILDGKGN